MSTFGWDELCQLGLEPGDMLEIDRAFPIITPGDRLFIFVAYVKPSEESNRVNGLADYLSYIFIDRHGQRRYASGWHLGRVVSRTSEALG